MIYGYARVSTVAQDLTSQLAQLKAAGCERTFREKITGTTADRPQLAKLMAVLTHGDVVIIPAVDRLSRDTTDLMVIARDMQRAGAGLRSLAEPVLDTTGDFAELVLAMLGVAAKLERRRIAERTARGRADAKAKGVQFGRRPKLTPHQQREARKRIDDGETQRSVARSYNVSQATISRLAEATPLNCSSKEAAVYRHDLARVYELREMIQNPLSPNAYFRDFDNRLRADRVMLKHLRDIEKELQGLDASAWSHLKGKAAPFLIKKNETRGWQQLLDTLNEAKGYNHLLQMGCTNVEFIPVSSTRGQRTPDLQGILSGKKVLCEVKTINVSEAEADRRHSGAAGSTHLQLPDGFFRKLKSDLEAAKNQMVKFDAGETVRRVVYIIVNFDDSLHQYVDDYTSQIKLFVTMNQMPEIETAFHIKPPYYSATV